MSSDRWQKMNDLFLEALDMPEEERSNFLQRATGDDEAMAQSIFQMLHLDQEAESFLDHPLARRPSIPWPSDTSGDPNQIAGTLPRAFQDHFEPGQRVGPYRLIRKLGEGGMSLVFLAEKDDEAFDRQVALKVLRAGFENQTMARRLQLERQILADLDHPYIARLFDGGTTEEGLPYLVMERIRGVPIDVYCDQHRLSLFDRLELCKRVAEAVRFAHESLVVHRDLKPSNILVQHDGTPKLLDFGIAKLLAPSTGSEAQPTEAFLRALTPDFASPEQVRGLRITTASDVYSMGALLYFLLVGRLPFLFEERSPEAMDRIYREESPPQPSRFFSDRSKEDLDSICRARADRPEALSKLLRGDLEAILLKALRTEPHQRYGSMEQLCDDLDRYQEGFPVLARKGSRSYKAGKFLKRHRLASAAIAGALATLLIFSVLVSLLNLQLTRERDRSLEIQGFLEDAFALADPGTSRGEEWTIRDALDRGAARLEQRLGDQPQTQSDLLHVIGRIYNNLGLEEEAQATLTRALETRIQEFGSDSLEVAITRMDWSQTLLGLGRMEEAEAEARSAVDTIRSFPKSRRLLLGRRGSQEHPLLANALNSLVSVLCQRSRYRDADPLSREALQLARSHWGEAQTTDLQAINNRAVVEKGLGNYDQAAALYSEGLNLSRQLFGRQHPLVLTLLGNLAAAQRRGGQSLKAAASYREALRISEFLFGPDHSSRINPLSGLALTLAQAKDPAAERAFQRALAARRSHKSSHSGGILRLSAHFSQFLLEQGRPGEAEALLLAHLPSWRRDRTADDVYLALVENTLGACALQLGRLPEAEALLLRSFEIIRRKEDGQREHTQQAIAWLVELYQQTDQPALADRYRSLKPGT